MYVRCLVAGSYPTPCDLMDCSPPGSSVHGILQARRLEWAALLQDGCESWTIKKAGHQRIDVFWTVVLDNTLESHLYNKEIKPVNAKGNKSSIFIGRIDAEAKVPILWPPDAKNWLIRKILTLEKIEGREGSDRKWDGWMASPTWWTWAWESSRSWWWTGKPACCSTWGCKEQDWTEWLNWTELSCFPGRNDWACSTWFETLEDRTAKETGRRAGSNSR